MGDEFNYLNLCSIYKTDGYSTVPMSENPCYAKTLNKWQTERQSKKVDYEIILTQGACRLKDDHKNNACFLNRKEIEQHLRMVKTIHNFTYRLEDGEYHSSCNGKDYKAWHLFVTIEGTKAQHKFVLTSIRHLYEYPFNMWLIDAHRLRESAPDTFKYVSILNLLQIVKSAFPDDYMTDQSLMFKKRKFHTKKSVKARLARETYITKIYNEETSSDRTLKYIESRGNSKLRSIDYWLGQKSFEERRAVYLDNYENFFKKEEEVNE